MCSTMPPRTKGLAERVLGEDQRGKDLRDEEL